MIAVAAIGSVGETTAPSTNAAAHGSPGTIVVRDDGDDDHRQQDEPDREQPDRPHVRAQVASAR